jgi:hypothetical protein
VTPGPCRKGCWAAGPATGEVFWLIGAIVGSDGVTGAAAGSVDAATPVRTTATGSGSGANGNTGSSEVGTRTIGRVGTGGCTRVGLAETPNFGGGIRSWSTSRSDDCGGRPIDSVRAGDANLLTHGVSANWLTNLRSSWHAARKRSDSSLPHRGALCRRSQVRLRSR